jgi:hypothetical protein
MRLVTRGDMDGVTSAVLITEMEQIDTIELIHPQDITDRKFQIRSGDIMANLPYHPEAALWFDHHELTDSNLTPPPGYRGRHAPAPSAARVIYDHYASDRLRRYELLVAETDRFDSADLTERDILNPRDYILLGFTIDSRTGIGDFKGYFLDLVENLKQMTIEEILQEPEVAARVRMMQMHNVEFFRLLMRHSRQEANVIVTDFRQSERVPVGNRFLVYTLFPTANVSLRAQWGPGRRFVALSVGHNILNRTSRVNCGQLCSDYGGGGHVGAGACPLPLETADRTIAEIVARLKAAG